MVAYHCAESLVPGGFIGLDVFFVISGYLIGILGYKEVRGRSFSIARFYERRAKPIRWPCTTIFATIHFQSGI